MGQTTVYKDGQPVHLPWDTSTVDRLKNYLGVPADRNLVQREEGSTRFLNNQEVLQLQDGMNFGEAPRFRYGGPSAWLGARLEAEAGAIQVAYRCPSWCGFDDSIQQWWVYVSDFPLPYGWNYAKTPIMITVPQTYPQAAPDGFYLSHSLRNQYDQTPGHYFETSSRHNRFTDRGWAWFCIHPEAWRPGVNIMEGDSIFQYLTLIHGAMSEVVR